MTGKDNYFTPGCDDEELVAMNTREEARPLFQGCTPLEISDFYILNGDGTVKVSKGRKVKADAEDRYEKIIDAVTSEIRKISDQYCVPVEAKGRPRLYYMMDEIATTSLVSAFCRQCGTPDIYSNAEISMIRSKAISRLLGTVDCKEVDPALTLFQNGMVNVLSPSDPKPVFDEAFTGFVPHRFVMNPERDNIVDKFMNDITKGDLEQQKLIWEMIGACFYNKLEFKSLFLLTGQRSCGKSTLQRFIKFLLGKGNFSTHKLEDLGERFNRVDIFGKMAIIGDDIDTKYIKDTGFVKSITAGEGVTGEYKGKQGFSFDPYALPIFSCNGKPSFPDNGLGVSCRFVIIECKADFSRNPDPLMSEKLCTEHAAEYAIFKAVMAYKSAHEHSGFSLSNDVIESRHQFEKDLSPLRNFLIENWFNLDSNVDYDRINTLRIGKQSDREMYYYYSQWLTQSGLSERSEKAFRTELKDTIGAFNRNSTCKHSPLAGKEWRLAGKTVIEPAVSRYIRIESNYDFDAFLQEYTTAEVMENIRNYHAPSEVVPSVLSGNEDLNMPF